MITPLSVAIAGIAGVVALYVIKGRWVKKRLINQRREGAVKREIDRILMEMDEKNKELPPLEQQEALERGSNASNSDHP